ncbi:MAG: hypothetical protein KME28_13445 [Pelatocladus maniniholoensis HA4357-MV3]|uniref:Uncharacterized protein n=1 Tax=Pelatocladus maniniholoensis HA4357-MV3 TaxID=1117104 RepID=A0A9E3LT51_9NOST|nr:hypothetical protein [Pelatocladus maniniholoensis HA4357-MV3]
MRYNDEDQNFVDEYVSDRVMVSLEDFLHCNHYLHPTIHAIANPRISLIPQISTSVRQGVLHLE